MNRILPVLVLIALLFAGFLAAVPAQADGTTSAKAKTCTHCAAGKTTKSKAAFHRTTRQAASCCTSGKCCAECPTCCQNNTCNTGKCPKGCCNMAACQPGAPCCK